MLSSDSPGTLSLSAKITKLPNDSPGSLCQSHHSNLSLSLATLQALSLFLAKVTRPLTQPNYKSHMQRNSVVFTYFSHAYHYCQDPYRLYLPNLSYSNGSKVFQPCSVLWYLPKICSRISQICLCISVSNSLRWSRNIAMMSRWFAFRRTSSSTGKSHSKRTSKVCISRNTLVTFSKPIIQPMYCSSIASRNGRLSRRLSILSTDRMAIFFPVHRHLSQTRTNIKLVQTHHLCLQDLLQPQSVSQNQLTYFSLLISRQVVGVFTVQTPHLCLQDLLPTSTYQSYLFLFAYLQASCRSLHCPNTSLVSPGLTPNLSLSRYSQCSSPGKFSESSLSKHLTCVSRTYSQPQPVEIFSMLISRQVVGVFTVQTPHLCLQDLLPTSACRDILSISKNMSSPAINWQVTFNKWPYSQHATKMKWDKNTAHELSIFTGSCFACGISLPLCFIIAQVSKQKKTHGTQFFQIDAAGLFSPLCAVHCFWCMRVLC